MNITMHKNFNQISLKTHLKTKETDLVFAMNMTMNHFRQCVQF